MAAFSFLSNVARVVCLIYRAFLFLALEFELRFSFSVSKSTVDTRNLIRQNLHMVH